MQTYTSFPADYFGKNPDSQIASREQTLQTCKNTFRSRLINFIEVLPQNAVVLDSGCGNGKATKMVLSLRPDVTMYAIDITDTSQYLPEGVQFKIGSVDDVDKLYEENFFDAIIQMHVIEHLTFPIDMISSHRSVLKPGGTIYIETPNWVRAFTPFSDIYFYNDYTHIRPFSIFAMTKLLSEFEFDDIQVHSVHSMTFFSPNDSLSCCTHKLVNLDTCTHPSIMNAKLKIQRTTWQKTKTVIKKVLLRFIHPLLKDVLVAVARKPMTP
ncbi:MAG: Methyltransferase type 11 [Candidatus Kaiserbacteria bacterium]|nr:Methyltransferase type 11 [Candidatus Kaiserbacteria bacterium]